MNLALAVLHLHPDADPRIDFRVADDGSGQRIEHWGIDAPVPDEDELQAAWKAYEAAPAPQPTKAELITQIQALMAQVEALPS